MSRVRRGPQGAYKKTFGGKLMVKSPQGDDAVQTRLWEAIEKRGVGMLGLTKSGLHAQPMIAFVERPRRRLWFIARNDNDLVRSVGDGGSGDFVYQDGDLMASISGALSVVEDRRRMARYWNAAVSAWLPEGLHDAKLTLLRMDCVDAEVWISGLGLTKFAWEIAWTRATPPIVEFQRPALATLH
jgi:general stress protein 26